MTKNEVLTQDSQLLHAKVGDHIGHEMGAKMIKDYFDKFNEGGAHFVGRVILERILNQPGCIGINIYKALDEKSQKTYVLVGVNQDGTPILEVTAVNAAGELRKDEGIVADRNSKLGWWEDVFGS